MERPFFVGMPIRYLFDKFQIANPKRHFDETRAQDRPFPYYAGYSESFTRDLLASAKLEPDAKGLDPWNGSGTTIRALRDIGCHGTGIDLNPVMVIVAKASLLSENEAPSLLPLAESLLDQASEAEDMQGAEPLLAWLFDDSASFIRRLETAINRSLIRHESYLGLTTNIALARVSPLAAFYYLALFRSVRRLLSDYVGSNPTWVKLPVSGRHRRRPHLTILKHVFKNEISKMTNMLAKPIDQRPERQLRVLLGSSEAMPLRSRSIDFVVGSPPYCTRIDYAVATAIELAILRIGESKFDQLRRSLMGTSTVESAQMRPMNEWGVTCTQFLDRLHDHPSKASRTYYFKNHVQYFASLYNSMSEVARVLRKRGACVLVVQDSHYKEIHNDVPQIAREMAANCGMRLVRKDEFRAVRSMVHVNSRATKYLQSRSNVEAILCLERE